MDSKLDRFVIPGDTLHCVKSHKNVIIVGPGLVRDGETNDLTVTRAGLFRWKLPNVYWIECKRYKYCPNRGDFVVGVITKKTGDAFKVDIGTAYIASISQFAFEGATKKQKANVQVGDAIYGRVLTAHKEMEPDLVCVDRYLKAFNYGKLAKEGMLLQLPMHITNKILTANVNFLRIYGKKHPLEVAIGNNGFTWLNGKSPKETLKLIKALHLANNFTKKEMEKYCKRYLK